jgi:hypothetical protein
MMAPFALLGCLWPLLAIAILAGCVINVLYAIVPAVKPRQASCGRCGYPVAGLTSPACPECGGDLSRVGVSTRALATRLRGGLASALIGWTVLCVVAAFFLFFFLGVRSAVAGSAASTPAAQTWVTPIFPASKSFSSVELATTFSWGSATPAPPHVALTLRLNDQSAWTMDIDGAAGTYEVRDPNERIVVQAAPYGPGAVGAFFQAAGLNPSVQPLSAEAAELEKVTELTLLSPGTQVSMMNLRQYTPGTMSFSGGTMAATPFAGTTSLVGMFWPPAAVVIVWGLGLCAIPAWRRRLLRRLDA